MLLSFLKQYSRNSLLISRWIIGPCNHTRYLVTVVICIKNASSTVSGLRLTNSATQMPAVECAYAGRASDCGQRRRLFFDKNLTCSGKLVSQCDWFPLPVLNKILLMLIYARAYINLCII